jgi:hypothetical protein
MKLSGNNITSIILALFAMIVSLVNSCQNYQTQKQTNTIRRNTLGEGWRNWALKEQPDKK